MQNLPVGYMFIHIGNPDIKQQLGALVIIVLSPKYNH